MTASTRTTAMLRRAGLRIRRVLHSEGGLSVIEAVGAEGP